MCSIFIATVINHIKEQKVADRLDVKAKRKWAFDSSTLKHVVSSWLVETTQTRSLKGSSGIKAAFISYFNKQLFW